MYFRGVPENLKSGGGAQFKAKPAGPDIVKGKKGHHALRLSFIRMSSLLCAFVCAGWRPPWVRPCIFYEIVLFIATISESYVRR